MHIVLHALDQSRSLRIVWLLEELGLPYELRQHQRQPDTMLAPETLKTVHPLGKAPVLQDGDLVLPESGAIVDYLVTRYGDGRFQPARDSADYWHYQQWLHYAEGSFMPLMLLALVFRRMCNAPVPFFVKPVARKLVAAFTARFLQPQTALHLQYVNSVLANRPWLMGQEPTGADIMMSFAMQAALLRVPDAAQHYPHIAAYVRRIEQRPAYQRAVAKAGTPLMPW